MQQVLEMKDKGLSWSIIASYFNMTTNTLRKHRKHYEQQIKEQTKNEERVPSNICSVVETSGRNN